MSTAQKTIALTHGNLAILAYTYGLRLPKEGLVLVGLRGSHPLKTGKGFTARWDLALEAVDYRHLRCTLAIWDRSTRQCFAALGSTVPHADQVAKAAARKGSLKGKGTNQIEPGFYSDLTKGEHLQGKERGHQALRETASRFYRRSSHAAPYRVGDPLYYANPYDNLHCAWNLDSAQPGYSSSGCMVVAGMPHCPRLKDSGPNAGAWKTFHDILYASPQRLFPFFLISGLEAWRILSEEKPSPRLIFGSRGDAVIALQKKLIAKGHMGGKPTGYLGTSTYRAWNAAGLRGFGDVLGCR